MQDSDWSHMLLGSEPGKGGFQGATASPQQPPGSWLHEDKGSLNAAFHGGQPVWAANKTEKSRKGAQGR